MNKEIRKILEDKGYKYNDCAQAVIKECDDWYCGRQTDFHKRTNINGITTVIPTVNMAKRVCSDDANLCEIVEINSGKDVQKYEAITKIMNANRFTAMFRKQLEQISASGTVGCYAYITNARYKTEGDAEVLESGDIRLTYCEAENIIPLTVVNDEVVECAFVGTDIHLSKRQDVLVIFTLDESGNYTAETHVFIDDKEDTEQSGTITLSDVRPFAIMHTADVNNFDGMEGYGYPKLYSCIPVLKMLDLAFAILNGDLDKGEKMVFINELLACIKQGADGLPHLTKKQQELFILLGEKLPDAQSVVQEYNPVIRVDDITKVIETLLSILSMTFGFGTKKYTFENGQIKTASEYIGERQDCMQEVNKQRAEATEYIQNIVAMVGWYANRFNNASWNVVKEDVTVEYDDSYIEDRKAKLEQLRADAMTFDIPWLLVQYISQAYNMTEEEAQALIDKANEKREEENPTDEDE